MELTQKKCVACKKGTPPMRNDEVETYIKEVPGWSVTGDYKKIEREFAFSDFKKAMVFVNKVADIAEREGHHPDLRIFYNRVKIELWTHAVDGLSENDFIVAAKVGQLVL